MILIILFNLIPAGLLILVAYSFKRYSVVLLISFLGIVLAFLMVFSDLLLLQSLLILICTVIYGMVLKALSYKKFDPHPRTHHSITGRHTNKEARNKMIIERLNPHVVAGYSLSIVLLCGGFSFYLFQSQINNLYELQKEYPVISLADRLAYEDQPPNSFHTEDVDIKLNEKLEARLLNYEETEENFYSSRRLYTLEHLHDRAEAQFIAAQAIGFGVTRGRRVNVSKGAIKLKEQPLKLLPVIPQDYPGDDFQYNPETGEFPLTNKPDSLQHPTPTTVTLTKMHDEGKSNFINQESLGYVKNRNYTVGFQKHAFSVSPYLNSFVFDDFAGQFDDPLGPEDEKTNDWKIHQLQLVSLLKHEHPVVYSTPTLPDMEDLKNVKTRPLESFEKQALSKLFHQEDIVIKWGVNHIQMMGALRASNGCLTCHSVKRGTLLGAFSYRLYRVKPMTQK